MLGRSRPGCAPSVRRKSPSWPDRAKADFGKMGEKTGKGSCSLERKPLVCGPLCEEGFLVFRFLVANFFKFLAANLSFTQFVTWAEPLYCVDSVHHSAPYYEKKGHRTVAFFNRLSAPCGACFFRVWAGQGRRLPAGEHIEIPRIAGGVVDGHVQIVPLDLKAEVDFQIVLPPRGNRRRRSRNRRRCPPAAGRGGCRSGTRRS